jgi:NitT/TauT family transport system substrate-binding protein
MKKNLKTAISIVIAFSLIALFAALIFAPAEQEGEVTLAMNPVPLSALVFIAEEKAFFQEEGLNVETAKFQTGKLALDALLGGGADIATTADVPIALAGLSGLDFKTVSTIAWSENDVKIVARRDSGILSPSDLKGKKIGSTAGGGPLFFIHRFLEREEIPVSEVQLTYMSPPDMVNALSKHELDAIVIFGPFHFNAQRQLGDKAIIFSPDDLYGETWNIVVSPAYAQQNPENVRAFLEALYRAEQFLKENRAEAIEITAKHSGVEKAVLEGYWDDLHFELALNNVLFDYLPLEAEWAISQGISASITVPDYTKLVDNSFLSAVKQ